MKYSHSLCVTFQPVALKVFPALLMVTSLKSTEESLIRSRGDQHFFQRIDLPSHDPPEEFSQNVYERRVALRKGSHHVNLRRPSLFVLQRHSQRGSKSLHTYERSGILVHLVSSVHGCTQSLLDEFGRGEVRKALSKIHWVVVGCQLYELQPSSGSTLPLFLSRSFFFSVLTLVCFWMFLRLLSWRRCILSTTFSLRSPHSFCRRSCLFSFFFSDDCSMASLSLILRPSAL
ncbi:hypothetical protein EYF80_021623 [Liparis tanakae]|uniref:Uncharacterized protein n=1 Tax=Liparis tanakae TaxID=230148 RepID=A0A4Z2HR87_9TELE|nr:hypothetical protein EYF80_021623 [Liparis tanakae]